MPRQLPLHLAVPSSYGRADFLPAAANESAVAWIERWPDWPGPSSALAGPAGSGKTHLLHLWADIGRWESPSTRVLQVSADIRRNRPTRRLLPVGLRPVE